MSRIFFTVSGLTQVKLLPLHRKFLFVILDLEFICTDFLNSISNDAIKIKPFEIIEKLLIDGELIRPFGILTHTLAPL